MSNLTIGAVPDELISMDELKKTARSFGMAAHPVRCRILDFLETSGKPERVTEIVAVCEGLGQAIVSQQLKILRDAGLLSHERRGACVYYSLLGKEASCLLIQVRSFGKEVPA
jgi:DNA-binding transcriptional ArsR family regulator